MSLEKFITEFFYYNSSGTNGAKQYFPRNDIIIDTSFVGIKKIIKKYECNDKTCFSYNEVSKLYDDYYNAVVFKAIMLAKK